MWGPREQAGGGAPEGGHHVFCTFHGTGGGGGAAHCPLHPGDSPEALIHFSTHSLVTEHPLHSGSCSGSTRVWEALAPPTTVCWSRAGQQWRGVDRERKRCSWGAGSSSQLPRGHMASGALRGSAGSGEESAPCSRERHPQERPSHTTRKLRTRGCADRQDSRLTGW